MVKGLGFPFWGLPVHQAPGQVGFLGLGVLRSVQRPLSTNFAVPREFLNMLYGSVPK